MAIQTINNGDSGLISRNKINNNFQFLEKLIDLTLNFKNLEVFEFVMLDDYKISSIDEQDGVTTTVKLGGTSTDYNLGDTVSGGDKLDISVDVIGAINIKGEII